MPRAITMHTNAIECPACIIDTFNWPVWCYRPYSTHLGHLTASRWAAASA